jgi:hypothetical protein
LFGEVLCLCAKHGLASVGVIAVDGTKLAGNASRNANVDYEQLAREILEEAQVVDAAEDELYGDARGDELPEQLRTGEGRRAWLREAKRQLEQQRAEEARPVPRNRGKRLKVQECGARSTGINTGIYLSASEPHSEPPIRL